MAVAAPTKMTSELVRNIEDQVRELIDKLPTLEHTATLYLQLHAEGMTLERARAIRVKAGMSD